MSKHEGPKEINHVQMHFFDRNSIGVACRIDPSELGKQTRGFAPAEAALRCTCQLAIAWPSKQMSDFEQDLGRTSAGA